MNNNPALGIIDKIVDFVNRLTDTEERFTNEFEVNQTCMILIVIYVFLFIYKKEVVGMVNSILK
tara:strand:- start:6423 stop:6614 length:192 start_codon:yes stop_codon:yes gene_type:complete